MPWETPVQVGDQPVQVGDQPVQVGDHPLHGGGGDHPVQEVDCPLQVGDVDNGHIHLGVCRPTLYTYMYYLYCVHIYVPLY